MSRKFIAVSLFVGFGTNWSPTDAAEARPPYKFLRYDEDYRFLADPAKKIDLWDWIKYIPLDGAGFLSFGGEARERFEIYSNDSFGASPNPDTAYFLQRYLFHLDYHPTGWLRVFAQLQSSLQSGRAGGPRPVDSDPIDTHQLFVDLVGNIRKDGQLTLRIGRQEMAYGIGRLIAPREGPNNRRAFDEVRLLYKQRAVSVDAFFGNLVEVDPTGAFDDWVVPGVRFWGVYATMPFPPLPGILSDFYYLGLINPEIRFNQGVEREESHTVGYAILWHSGPLGL